MIGLGWALFSVGAVLSPLPGPGGIPLAFLGLAVLLRHSRPTRRRFVRFKRRLPERWDRRVNRMLRRRAALPAKA